MPRKPQARQTRTETTETPIQGDFQVMLLRAETIKRIRTTSKGRMIFRDARNPALVMLIDSNRKKTFYVTLQIGEVERYILIGEYPETRAVDARRQATVIASHVANGNFSAGQKLASQVKTSELEKNGVPSEIEITFGSLFDLYYRQYASTRTRDYKELKENYDRHFHTVWGERPLIAIKRAEIQAWINSLSQTSGVYCANRCHDTMRAIFNWGIKSEYFAGPNPAKGIDRFPMQSRDRFVQPGDEFKRLATALDNIKDGVVRDFFWMCLYTGARRNNVLNMRWEQINLETRMWRIPVTKNGAPHIVSLTDQAIALLTKRRQQHQRLSATNPLDDWVFPSPRIKGAPLNSPRKAWERVCREAGIQDLRIHDLRRTLASYMAIQGASPAIIGKTLGHRSLSSTAIYSRLTQKPVLDAMQQATEMMSQSSQS